MVVTVGTRRGRAAVHAGPARWLAIPGLFSAVLAAWWMVDRGPDDGTWDVTVAWSVGFGLVVAAATVGRAPRRRIRVVAAALRHPSRSTVLGLGVTAVAAVLRLVALDRFPSVIDSDEGFFMLPARQARLGELGNPYDTSFYAVPELYRAWQGISSRPFADQIGSYRILGALLGAATVFLTWRIGRRLLGEGAGLAAAAVLAALPFHLWLSRMALNNVVNGFTLALAVLFTLRTLDRGDRFDATFVGVALGIGLYGYYPAAVFPLVLAAAVAAALALGRRRPAPAPTLRLGAWATAGFLASAAPIIGFYLGDPETFTSRFRTVAGSDSPPGLADRLADAAQGVLYPVLRQGPDFAHAGFYRQGPPFLGWPVAAVAAVGLAAWFVRTAHGLRHGTDRTTGSPVVLLVLWVAISAGASQTTGMQSQRFAGVAFLWALAAGSGLVGVVRVLVRGWEAVVPGPVPRPAAVGAVVLLMVGVGHLRGWFDEDRQLTAYGDLRTSAAYDLGWRLGRASTPAVLVAGQPMFSTAGFGNLRFLAPDAGSRVTDLDPFPPGADGRPVAPDLYGGELLVLLVERDDAERCALVERHPDVVVEEAVDANGVVLYAVYAVADAARLPDGTTPAGTRLVAGNARWVGDRRISCG